MLVDPAESPPAKGHTSHQHILSILHVSQSDTSPGRANGLLTGPSGQAQWRLAMAIARCIGPAHARIRRWLWR